jgi:hypothetical protein
LHELTRDVPFNWTKKCQEAFNNLKKALTSSPVLTLHKDEGKFQLETDASDFASGVVLSQQQADGTYRPLGYSSKSFSEAEQWYTTYDKELLGIMRRLEEWRNLLLGAHKPFDILNDHQNLMYFKELQKLMGRQVNWTTKLQDYDFRIQHVSGETNRRADTLS